MKAIIIDDEPLARNLLRGMLNEYCPDVEVVDDSADLASGVKAIRKHKPDLVFLDIEMPGQNGLEIMDYFDEDDLNFSIIFVTAYNAYAIEAFKLSAAGYILKPIEAEELQTCVSNFSKRNSKQSLQTLRANMLRSLPRKMAIHSVSSVVFVELDDILFFEAEGAYTKVYIRDGRSIVTSKGLKHYETLLAANPSFFRCHKSYIVNLAHVNEYVKSSGGYLKVQQYEVGISLDKIATFTERMIS
jgi:two-component system LytT family response regulator